MAPPRNVSRLHELSPFCPFEVYERNAFGALPLLVGRQEKHVACKNFCLKISWDIVVEVNVSGRVTA